jgi:hypothetical protein
MVKLVVPAVLLMTAFSSSLSFATTKEKCAVLPTVQERQDCDVRKALSELPKDTEAKPVKHATSTIPDPLDELEKEDEKINTRIRGTICRGC